MRIWVTGATGTLGQHVTKVATRRGHTVLTGRVSIDVAVSVIDYVGAAHPDVIVNCAGVTPERRKSDAEMVRANALGPHCLAIPGVRLIHVSTDCVFSGEGGTSLLESTRRPDPSTLYGRTKLAGESASPHVLNVRTSFVDWSSGLLAWLVANQFEQSVDGWANALWNGGTASEVAEQLVELAEGLQTGTVHLARPTAISKAQLLDYAARAATLHVAVKHVPRPVINRALAPDVEIRGTWADFADTLAMEYPYPY